MAYMMDTMGNVIGEFETEEERRKREEEQANAIAQKIEVKTYGDGRQVQTTTQQLPPSGVQVAGPISPDTFSRMIQAESGGRQFAPSGQVLTSPKGAMGVAQIMPSTAMQPGYGVPNIFDLAESQGMRVGARDEATARQLLGNEQLNRQFGQNYANAMRQQFGSDQAAAAAYNAGPGAVQRNMAGNQGQMNVAGLPGETQGYLDKVFRGAGQAITNMFPSAQAGTLPPGQAQRPPTITAPVAPGQQPYYGPGQGEEAQTVSAPVAPGAMAAQPQPAAEPSSMYSLGTGQTGLGFQMPSGTPTNNPSVTGVPMTTTSAINMYQAAQDKPDELIKLRYDTNVPEFIRERAGQRAYEVLNNEIKLKTQTNDLKDEIERARNGDPRAANNIAKTLASKEGSWAKMILLGFISPQMAGEEAIKLGYGNKDVAVQDSEGKSYLVTVNAKGAPLSGISADGKQLSQEELIKVAAGTTPKKAHEMAQTLGSPVTKTIDGKLVNGIQMYDPKTQKMYVQYGDKKDYSPSGWTSSTQNLDLQRQRTIQEINLKLQGKTEEEKMAILRERNKLLIGENLAPIDPSEVGIRAPQIGGGAAPASATAPATTGRAAEVQRQMEGGGGAGTAPTGTPAAGTGARPTSSSIEAGAAAKKEIAKEAGKEVAVSAATQSLINSIDNKVVPLLDSGKHNIGSELAMFVGRGPVAQAVGKQFETQDAKNTKIILDTVNKLAVEGLKALGSNPSTADLKFWTENKPQGNSDPEFMKEWIQSRSEDLKRRLGYAQKQTEAGGTAGVAPEVKTELNARDKQALDWATANPNDPRAAEIRRRLGR